MSLSTVIKSAEHGFAIAYHDLISGIKAFTADAPKVAAAAQTDLTALEPIFNAIIAGASPEFLPFARGIEALLGANFAVIANGGTAVTLGEDVVAAVKGLVDMLKNHPAVQAATTTPATPAA